MMEYRRYAVYEGKIGKRKDNEALMQLLLLVAKKYRIVRKKQGSDKYVVLYSEKDNQWSKRKTMHFVAEQASIFIKHKIGTVNGRIGRPVSRRQIKKLSDDNNNATSIHALEILIVILQLLLYETNNEKYLKLINPEIAPLAVSPDYYSSKQDERDLACTFLKGHILRLKEDKYFSHYAPDTRPLCEYIIDCYEVLNHLVGNNEYRAVRVKPGNSEGLTPITEIKPDDFPEYPI